MNVKEILSSDCLTWELLKMYRGERISIPILSFTIFFSWPFLVRGIRTVVLCSRQIVSTVRWKLEPDARFSSCGRLLRQRHLPGQPAHGVAGRPARVRHQHHQQPAPVPVNVLRSPRPAQHPGRTGKESNGHIFHRGRHRSRSGSNWSYTLITPHVRKMTRGPEMMYPSWIVEKQLHFTHFCWFFNRSFSPLVRVCPLHVWSCLSVLLPGCIARSAAAARAVVIRGAGLGVFASAHQHRLHGSRRSTMTATTASWCPVPAVAAQVQEVHVRICYEYPRISKRLGAVWTWSRAVLHKETCTERLRKTSVFCACIPDCIMNQLEEQRKDIYLFRNIDYTFKKSNKTNITVTLIQIFIHNCIFQSVFLSSLEIIHKYKQIIGSFFSI